MLKKGKYRHYKGEVYTVLDFVFHTETEEVLVIYTADYEITNLDPVLGEKPKFARPLSMFVEKIEINGTTLERFSYLGAHV